MIMFEEVTGKNICVLIVIAANILEVYSKTRTNCEGDYNATKGSGKYCGNLCSNYNDQYVVCSESKTYNACDCKKGYVFNDIIGKGIHPNDCPKPCEGDHYAEKKVCAQLEQPTCANPRVKPNRFCTVSCECAYRYVLDRPNGKCIPYENCPDVGCNGDMNATITACDICGKPNCYSKYTNCAASCDGENRMGCRCKSGYTLSSPESTSVCIAESDCHWKT